MLRFLYFFSSAKENRYKSFRNFVWTPLRLHQRHSMYVCWGTLETFVAPLRSRRGRVFIPQGIDLVNNNSSNKRVYQYNKKNNIKIPCKYFAILFRGNVKVEEEEEKRYSKPKSIIHVKETFVGPYADERWERWQCRRITRFLFTLPSICCHFSGLVYFL